MKYSRTKQENECGHINPDFAKIYSFLPLNFSPGKQGG